MVMIEVARRWRVEVDDVDRVGIGLLQARGEGLVAERVLAVQFQWDERGWETGGVGGADHAAGGFADTEFGGEKTGDVQAKVGVAPGKVGGVRRVAVAEVEDHLAVRRFEVGEAELAVLVLGAKPLPGTEPGHAAEPGEEVGETDTREPKVEYVGVALRCGRQVEPQLECAHGRRAETAGRPAVEPGFESGQGALESARLRMRAEFTPQHHRRHVSEGGQLDPRGLPDPVGVGREFVEEQAGKSGKMGTEGSGGRLLGHRSHALRWTSDSGPHRFGKD